MGAPALLWPLLLSLLLTVLLGQPPGTSAQFQNQVCSVNQTHFQVKENENFSSPLVTISVPEGQEVTLGPESTPFAFRLQRNQLFLNVTPDFEVNPKLEAHLKCKVDNVEVTLPTVLVFVLDVNDNEPKFPFTVKHHNVSEDTSVGTTVIPEEQLKATDLDINDILFYKLEEVTPNAHSFFYLKGPSRPALMLNHTLDFDKSQSMTFHLIVRDTWEANEVPSHTATATLILNVLPADLRSPWFLPCSYSDGYVCIQPHYQGVVPTEQRLPDPLILSPGPIYAVDGDRGINQRIIYSIMAGNTGDTFSIDSDSGNLTMAKKIPSPTTFVLVVRADQADMARYSLTQVIVEARDTSGSTFQFSQSLYHGIVALGSGAGTRVMDASSPSEFLRLWAQYPDLPDFYLAVTYRITNCSEFEMDKNTILSTEAMEHAVVFYAEVEATASVTAKIATAVVEIRVSEQLPSTESPTSPEAGGTTGPLSTTTSEAPTASGTSQGPTTTSSGGGTGPLPTSSTALSPSASSKPEGPPTPGISDSTLTPKPETSQPVVPTAGPVISPQPVTPSGGSTETPKPGTSQPMTITAGTSTSPQPATPGGGSAQTPKPGTSRPTATEPSRTPLPSGIPGDTAGDNSNGQRFSTVDMAVLGGVLGALLLLALICLAVLIHKHYYHRLNCCSGKAAKSSGFENQAFVPEHEAGCEATSNPEPDPGPVYVQPTPSPPPNPVRSSPVPPSPEPPSLASAPSTPETTRAADSPSAVRSILTKERRPDSGYKAVWFGEDIGAEADVVVLNSPTVDMDAGDSDNEDSEDENPDQNEDPHHGAGADSTYI